MKTDKIKAEDIQSDFTIWIANKWKLVEKTCYNSNNDIIIFFGDDNQVIVNKNRKFNLLCVK